MEPSAEFQAYMDSLRERGLHVHYHHAGKSYRIRRGRDERGPEICVCFYGRPQLVKYEVIVHMHPPPRTISGKNSWHPDSDAAAIAMIDEFIAEWGWFERLK
jgi:hypothetical protein